MSARDVWGIWQKYGAQGMTGAEALVLEINRIVYENGIKSPVTSERGLSARLRYLDSPAGIQALREQGVTDRALKSWKEGKASPSAASRERIDNAYWTRRRENVIRSGALKRLLNNDGNGRRIEIYGVDQSAVQGGYSDGPGDGGRARHNVDRVRSIQGRYIWDDLVDAWAGQDLEEIDDIWDDVIQDIGSEYAAYAYVSAVSIGA
ncbi:hypothetical protein B7755_052065 [Streptomyces sp. NBS 14/10]|uniref:hypothetical protein n=1 Tax=Streptomyces sp. NBS 14/10 TaxID=1945643 RepID=UPI00211AA95C|nr:hypothetical protein [Streptomyces sp. NBS 14/10]KAK1176685.1 hypothetical protein B7755_052065 [Streptomyces sp. NBS 14/10]